MDLAITRQVSRSIGECELTFLQREPIDVARARAQHAFYEATLQDLGLAVLSLPEQPDLPDSVFVEDTALVLDECAILTRPGAASRQPEVDSIRQVLEHFRKTFQIQAPAQLDGGDILVVGRRIYVGLSRRSDTRALAQVQELLTPFGYVVHGVSVSGCLHLKSAATIVRTDTILVNPAWVDPHAFQGVKFIDVDPSEAYAANALRIGDAVLFSTAFPRTHEHLVRAGIRTVLVESDELAKAEGALTCCSLVLTL